MGWHLTDVLPHSWAHEPTSSSSADHVQHSHLFPSNHRVHLDSYLGYTLYTGVRHHRSHRAISFLTLEESDQGKHDAAKADTDAEMTMDEAAWVEKESRRAEEIAASCRRVAFMACVAAGVCLAAESVSAYWGFKTIKRQMNQVDDDVAQIS